MASKTTTKKAEVPEEPKTEAWYHSRGDVTYITKTEYDRRKADIAEEHHRFDVKVGWAIAIVLLLLFLSGAFNASNDNSLNPSENPYSKTGD